LNQALRLVRSTASPTAGLPDGTNTGGAFHRDHKPSISGHSLGDLAAHLSALNNHHENAEVGAGIGAGVGAGAGGDGLGAIGRQGFHFSSPRVVARRVEPEIPLQYQAQVVDIKKPRAWTEATLAWTKATLDARTDFKGLGEQGRKQAVAAAEKEAGGGF
jgi:hypothetical protein